MAKSPIKFGLGEYSNKPFELKSGNTPLFKHVGSSPYKQGTRFSPTTNTNTNKDKEKENKDIIVKGGGKRNIGQILAEGITGGLDAVYGTGKVKFDNTVQVAKNKEEADNSIKAPTEGIGEVEAGKMPDKDWKAGETKAKESGEDLNALVAKRETLTEGSAEWKENQNKINEALGSKKRYKID